MSLHFAFFKRTQRARPACADEAFSCFNVRTAEGGSVIGCRTGARKTQFLHCGPDEAASARAILFVPEGNRAAGFLMSPDAQEIATAGEVEKGVAICVRIDRGARDAPACLVHPMNSSWRLGPQGGQSQWDEPICFSHREPNPECAFGFEPIAASDLASPVRYAVREIANSLSTPPSWEAAIASIRDGSLRRGLLGAVLSCLPVDELQALAIRLLEDDKLCGLVCACLPDDRWLSQRLASLSHWRRNRDCFFGSAKVGVAEADDIPGATRALAHRPKLGLALNSLARRNTQARRMACVVGSARNEGPYLLDWIAHHRAVGFEHVFVYTNDNTDGSDELLDLLARAGVVTWLDNKMGPESLPQFRAYAHALSILPQILDYRWTLIADLDEYFTFDADNFQSVSDYLAWQEVKRSEAIALPWLLYVGGRDDVWSDASCIERFPRREENANPHVKSMFRTNLHWSSTCHNPVPAMEFPISYRAQNRTPHIAKPPEHNAAIAHNPQATHAWIAHYIFKSAPEAMMKVFRGKGDEVPGKRHVDVRRVAKPFLTLCNNPHLVHDDRTMKLAPAMRSELTRLRGIARVRDCERHIKQRFSAEMNAACLEFVRQGRVNGEAEECAVFRSILQRQRERELFRVAGGGL